MGVEQMVKLFGESARGYEPTELRDRAILKLLYATGIRVSELVSFNLDQLHLVEGMGYVQCFGKNSMERIVPIHDSVVQTLKAYLTKGRPALVRNPEEPAVFVNRWNSRTTSERLSRQTCQNIIKKCAQNVGIRRPVSPQVLRRSLATHMFGDGATLQ